MREREREREREKEITHVTDGVLSRVHPLVKRDGQKSTTDETFESLSTLSTSDGC